MSAAAAYKPFRFENLESYRGVEARLVNQFRACFPGRGDWKKWCEEVFADVLAAPAGLKAALTVSNIMRPEEAPQQYLLEAAATTIGRDDACDIVLPEQVITKRHARVMREGDRFLLEDLGSSAGTHRRSKKLEPGTPVELARPDKFSVFPYDFHFAVEHVWKPETDLEISRTHVEVLTGLWFEALSEPGSERFPIRIHPTQTMLVIEADRRLLEEIVTGLAPSLGPSAPAAGLLETDAALIEFFLLALAERVNRDLAWDLRIALGKRGTLPDEVREKPGIAVACNLRLRRETRTVRCFLPFSTIEAMRFTPRAAELDRKQLSWLCPVSVGSIELTPAELRSVERLDVLLPGSRAALWLPGGFRAGWSGSSQDGNFSAFRVDNYFETEQIVAEPESPAPEQAPETGPAFDAGQLPVQLHVVVGEKRLTLAELEQLREGSVVELDRGSDAMVDLAVNGKIVGRGELVQYEGALGVKVLGWRQP
jgi:type III secretion system YscQ/HrcQ family protein